MNKNECLHKSHNVSVLLYHYVCPAKYRRSVFDKNVYSALKDIYLTCVQKSLVNDPRGPSNSYNSKEPNIHKLVVRGGSFLCTDQYCSGFRISARMKNRPDTSLEHTGFR